MDRFLDTYNLSKLNHEAINHPNRSITRTVTESVIEKLSTTKSLGLDGFTVEFHQKCQEGLIPPAPAQDIVNN